MPDTRPTIVDTRVIPRVLKSFWAYLKQIERRHRDSFSHDIVDPVERKKSQSYLRWVDHEILRIHWHNFAEIAPGAYRSNHPTRERMEHYAQMGIKTIVNLRGPNKLAPYNFEVEACRDLGLDLIDIPLSARRAASRERMLELVDLLVNLPTPFLLHCKSGADRTGLASALYLMLVHDVPVEQAKKQLSIKYFHLNFTHTGILDYILWRYQQRNKENGRFTIGKCWRIPSLSTNALGPQFAPGRCQAGKHQRIPRIQKQIR